MLSAGIPVEDPLLQDILREPWLPADRLSFGTDPTLSIDFEQTRSDQAAVAKAIAACRSTVARGDTSPTILLNLAVLQDQDHRHRQAHELIAITSELLPTWDEPQLRLAESLRSLGDQAASEQAYRHVLELNPKRHEALIGLAALLVARGAGLEARSLLLRCCGVLPDRADAWDALGLGLMLTNEAAAAYSAFNEAQRLAPDVVEYALHGIDAARSAGQADAELARLVAVSDRSPLNPVPLIARGVLLEREGRRAEAIDSLEAASALAPDSLVPLRLLGNVLSRSHQLREAEQVLRQASELAPDDPGLKNDRATVLMRMHRHADAHALLTSVIAQHGDEPLVMCNLANATVCLGWQPEAVALARRAIALDPDAPLPRRALCNTLPYLAGVKGAELLASLRDCSARLPRSNLGPCLNDRNPHKRLTIGLLSGTLKTHPVGWLTVAGIEALDQAEFGIVCLAQNTAPKDPFTRRYRAVSEDWIEVDALDDVTLARRARARGIDILIDLGGYGDAARMPACAHRLAPVQIKWVGMQTHSTGLPEMDWILSDRWETPDGSEDIYSERLLRLADGYICYSPPAYAPDVGPLPALANGFVTFGCFNNLAKVTTATLDAWAAILHRLPTARFVLKTHQFGDHATAARLHAEFANRGICEERVELRGSSQHRAFLAEYNRIDIVLDPFPYSGGLTTCEALWMGVPTLTMPGEIFASRHSTSHLSNVGLFDWIACGVEDYVSQAVAKASAVQQLAALRHGLRAHVKRSPLCDARTFGRTLGRGLRHAWTQWCQS